MAVWLVYNACDIIVSAMIQSLLSKRPHLSTFHSLLCIGLCSLLSGSRFGHTVNGIESISGRRVDRCVRQTVKGGGECYRWSIYRRISKVRIDSLQKLRRWASRARSALRQSCLNDQFFLPANVRAKDKDRPTHEFTHRTINTAVKRECISLAVNLVEHG